MPITSREAPPRRCVSLTCVKVSKIRFSSSSILSVTTYSRTSFASVARSNTLTTPSTLTPMSRLMMSRTVVSWCSFSVCIARSLTGEQLDGKIVRTICLVHEVKLPATLFAGKRENNARSEVPEAAQDLAKANHRVERDCRVHEYVATWDSRGFLGEPMLKACLGPLRKPLLHPAIVLELLFLQGLNLFFREAGE